MSATAGYFMPSAWFVPCADCGTPVDWCAPREPANRKFVVNDQTLCFPCQDKRGVSAYEDCAHEYTHYEPADRSVGIMSESLRCEDCGDDLTRRGHHEH